MSVNRSNYSPGKKNQIINLYYDLVPNKLLSLLVSEIGLMPPTTVPVILREFQYYFDSVKYSED